MSHLIQIINARIVHDDQLVSQSLWFDSKSGVFVAPPNPASPVSVLDLQNRIVAPGFVDLQINGAYGFDFSEEIPGDGSGDLYTERFREVRRRLITTGTTSFLPTMTSQLPERYHKAGVLCSVNAVKSVEFGRSYLTTFRPSPSWALHDLAIPSKAPNPSAHIAKVHSSLTTV